MATLKMSDHSQLPSLLGPYSRRPRVSRRYAALMRTMDVTDNNNRFLAHLDPSRVSSLPHSRDPTSLASMLPSSRLRC